MTIVIARKFDERILILSDTMVSDLDGTRQNAIPGQLKALVINQHLSVAYAGVVELALTAIRLVHQLSLSPHKLQDLVDILVSASQDGACDFLIASHHNGPSIRKVFQGKLSDDLEVAWIGDAAATPITSAATQSDLIGFDSLHTYGSADESEFSRRFMKAFADRGTQLIPGVGGVPVMLLASPYGHCYEGYATSISWDTVNLSIGLTREQLQNRESGMTAFRVHGCDPGWRGISVYGTYFEQASTGYVYDPIDQDHPTRIPDVGLSEFTGLLKNWAGKKAGAVPEP